MRLRLSLSRIAGGASQKRLFLDAHCPCSQLLDSRFRAEILCALRRLQLSLGDLSKIICGKLHPHFPRNLQSEPLLNV
jgi:hypothetical protein